LATDPIDPSRGRPVDQAAAAAMEEAMKKNAFDVLRHLTPDQLIPANPQSEVIKGSALPPSGWMHAPAHFEVYAAADKRLTKAAEMAGIMVTKVDKVLAFLVQGTKIVVIKATHKNDPAGIPVNRYAGSSSAWINLITLLSEPGLTVPTGYREQYEVAFVPEGSPLWPGLAIDLGSPKDHRREYKRKAGPSPDHETP